MNAKLALCVCVQVGRKVVKQTVMTTVYGVTYIGARDQARTLARPQLAL